MVLLLAERGHEVTVLDNLSSGHREAVLAGRFEHADLSDRAVLDRVLASSTFDAVMHFAAYIRVEESVREPGKYFRNNFCNAVNLLEAMVRHRVKRFIFCPRLLSTATLNICQSTKNILADLRKRAHRALGIAGPELPGQEHLVGPLPAIVPLRPFGDLERPHVRGYVHARQIERE
ncbi:MAG: NAD-dependent epimerase/dehydratase family protein [Burkholderiales bacterium]